MRVRLFRTLNCWRAVGFFRRVLKLLYFGIKPVFVFDGTAPSLKRRTLATRKARRQGRQGDMAKTAERLLAAQMRKAALEHVGKRCVHHSDAGQHAADRVCV